MIPSQFDYIAPETVEEALAVLHAAGEDGKVLAGGQSLLPVLRMRLNSPEQLVDLGRIRELRQIREDGDDLVIGATATHDAVLHDPLVQQHALLLHETLTQVADPQVRHRGTVGGAVVHADPAGDLGAAVLALDAHMVIASPDGTTRTVTASDFFVDIFETAVGEDELLTQIRIPKHTGWGAHYEKFVRAAQQWSIVAAAATVTVEDGLITQAQIALTNMGPTPLRATAVEEALTGRPADQDTATEAAALATEGTEPPSDLNGSADYRRHLATILTRRALLGATES